MHLFDFSETFILVVDKGSFAKAAKYLNLAPSVVTRRINLLEEQLNVQLLVRTTRRLSLTDAGQIFYKRMKGVVEDWQQACDVTQNQAMTPTGSLRIACPSPLTWLADPVVLDFVKKYPDIQVSYYQIQKRVDILAEGIDVAMGGAVMLVDNDGIVERLLGRSYLVYLASPKYLAEYGTPTKFQDLTQHRIIKWQQPYMKTSELREFSLIDSPRALQINSLNMGLEAAEDGYGIVEAPIVFCHQQLREKKLVQVLKDDEMPIVDISVWYAWRRFVPLNIRLFVDHMLNSNVVTAFKNQLDYS